MSKNSAFIDFKIEGVDHLLGRLAAMRESTKNKYLRRAVTKASRIVRKAARDKLNTGRAGWEATNLLKKSLTVRVRTYGGGRAIVGVVGPGRDFRQTIRTRKKDRTFTVKIREKIRDKRGRYVGSRFTGELATVTQKAGSNIDHVPALIAHLVEFGHGGPKPAPAHPFIRPAWEDSREACIAAIRDTLEAGIVTELSK